MLTMTDDKPLSPLSGRTEADRRIVNDARNARAAAARAEREDEARVQLAEAVDGATAYERLARRQRILPTYRSFLSDPDDVQMEEGPDGRQVPVLDANGDPIPLTLDHIQVHSLGPCDQRCTACGAMHWAAERTGGGGDGSFSMCCQKGQVDLPDLPAVPQPLVRLMESAAFRRQLRGYNGLFAMASSSATYAGLPGISEFRISGALHHRVGPLVSNPGHPPAFAQLYILDADDQLRRRNRTGRGQGCRPEAISTLQRMFAASNPLVRNFVAAKERLDELEREAGGAHVTDLQINISTEGALDIRRYNMPTGNPEVAAFIPQGQVCVGVKRVRSGGGNPLSPSLIILCP